MAPKAKETTVEAPAPTPSSATGTTPAVEAEAHVAVIDYVCGLRRVGPSRYVLVTGRVVDGVADLEIGRTPQTLDLAADELRSEFQRMVGSIIP